MSVAEMSSVKTSFASLDFEASCRALQIDPIYSSAVYNDSNPATLGHLSPEVIMKLNSSNNLNYLFEHQQLNSFTRRLEESLDDSSVKVPINIHCDDASMVTSKMWKSASVIGCQVSIINS